MNLKKIIPLMAIAIFGTSNYEDASCTTTSVTGNITQNRIIYDCRIAVQNSKISNNAAVELNAEKDVII